MPAFRFADRRSATSPETVWLVGGTIALVVVLLLLALSLGRLDFDVVVGGLVLITLTLASLPLLKSVAKAERDPSLLTIMLLGLATKIIFTLIRYYFITVIYGDNGDAGLYSLAGSVFMESYRKGNFILSIPEIETRGPETERIAAVCGMIYTITGVSRYSASFVFSWFCYTGQIMTFRAFRRGVPEGGDGKRYLILLLFLPSLLFWPSSIGKEALMLFAIGFVCFGAAKILTPPIEAFGAVYFALGAAGLFFIRPHMALIAIVSLAFASAVSTVVKFSAEPDKKATSRSFAFRMVTLTLLIAGGAFATTQLSSILTNNTDDGGGISEVLAKTQAQTSEGGSVFTPPAVTSPIDIPNAVLTVLFRPYPWEAHNLNGIIASSEGLLLAGLMIAGRRRLLAWVKALGRRPYLVFALAFALCFIMAFSYIGNFGILARQRTQMLPLALVVLGMAPAPRKRASWMGHRGQRIEDPTKADRVGTPHPRAPELQSFVESGRRLPQGESQ